ncbi:hypothetical protein KBD11_00360 [Candidatus Saccharibacteria bacterium]|nr:hypothetical protein [Candidatus Saccharibacteria bacterium]
MIDQTVVRLARSEQRLLGVPGVRWLELPNLGDYQPVYDTLACRREELQSSPWGLVETGKKLLELVQVDYRMQKFESMQDALRQAGLKSELRISGRPGDGGS